MNWLPPKNANRQDANVGDAAPVPRLLLKPREAAAALGVCEKSLWSMTTPRGDIPCVRINRSVRYDPGDLKAWIDRRKALGNN